VVHPDVGSRAVAGLLQHFSVKTESVVRPDDGALR
jgi:hypothetical protein